MHTIKVGFVWFIGWLIQAAVVFLLGQFRGRNLEKAAAAKAKGLISSAEAAAEKKASDIIGYGKQNGSAGIECLAILAAVSFLWVFAAFQSGSLVQSIEAHPVIWAMSLYYLFSSAVGAMPTPKQGSGAFYQWAFTFSHILAANAARVVATKSSFPASSDAAKGGA